MIKVGLKQAVIYDELFTPKKAVYPILKYLNKKKIYWECTGKNSNITKVLRENGFNVIETNEKQIDFLKSRSNFDYDIIITNPPYSLKNAFLRRCYELNKPFIMLLPITALESIERGKLFRKYGVQLIVLDKRIDFTGKKSCWFNTSWFCWKILDNDLKFVEVKEEVEK